MNKFTPPYNKIYTWDLQHWSHISRHCCIQRQTFSKSIHSGCKNASSQLKPFSSCHRPGVKKGFVKGEALRLLCTNTSKQLLKRTFTNSNHVSLLEVIRNVWLRHFYRTTNSHEGNQCWTKKGPKDILPFMIQNHPGVPNLKKSQENLCYFWW